MWEHATVCHFLSVCHYSILIYTFWVVILFSQYSRLECWQDPGISTHLRLLDRIARYNIQMNIVPSVTHALCAKCAKWPWQLLRYATCDSSQSSISQFCLLFPLWRPRFDSVSVHVEFVVNKVAVPPPVPHFSPEIIIPPHTTICDWSYRKSRSVPLLPLCALMACHRVNYAFHYSTSAPYGYFIYLTPALYNHSNSWHH